MAGGDEKAALYKLRISIDTPEGVPAVWRELMVSGSASLADLGVAIKVSFGWSGEHKHEWVAEGGPGGAWNATDPMFGPPEFDDEYRNEEEITLEQAAPRVGCRLTYKYDITDPWYHEIEVTGIESAALPHHSTRLTGGARAGIPEDCGGASGYAEFLEAVADASHPDHGAMTAWYKSECPNGGGSYDPEKVDFEGINRELAEIAT